MFRQWMTLAFEASLLAVEAQQVVALRLLKLSRGGPAASLEAQRMVAEKASALAEAAAKAATGREARSIVRTYRAKVRANRRRLTRG